MDNYNIINILVEKSNRIPQNAFVTLILTGLFQYGFLVIGVCIFITLTFMLIRKKNE